MRATLVSGDGVAADFVAAAEQPILDTVEFRPYHGTFNLDGLSATDSFSTLSMPDVGDDYCDGVDLHPCAIGGVRAAIIKPHVPGYPDSKTELIAPVRLRDLFGFEDGDAVSVAPLTERWSPTGLRAAPRSLGLFDAVAFDLDGTLVDLAVDWETVHDEVEELLDAYLDEPITEYQRNDVFAIAQNHDAYDELERLLEGYETDGAADATPLDLVETVSDFDCPVAVCTANAGKAAEIALDHFGALDAVDCIVSRETLAEGKPHPRPLLDCFDALDVRPGNAVFVGDERTDAEAATRAETSFLHPDQLG